MTVGGIGIHHTFSGQRLVPNPFAMFPCRTFTVLGLCSSLQPMVLQGLKYFARIAKHVWTCTLSQSQRVAQPLPQPHSTLAQGLENKPKKNPKPKNPTPSWKPKPSQKLIRYMWMQTHRTWIYHPCVFLHSLSPVIFPLGYFYILTPSLISTLFGVHYGPGVTAAHPFPSCSGHVVRSAYRWFAKARDLAAVHFSTLSSSSSLLVQITLNFITLLCIAWLPDPVVYG